MARVGVLGVHAAHHGGRVHLEEGVEQQALVEVVRVWRRRCSAGLLVAPHGRAASAVQTARPANKTGEY